MANVRYFVEVQGHEPPYRWRVYREGHGMGRSFVQGCEGESDSITDARFAANEAARAAEVVRWHSATKRSFDLFEVEEKPDLADEDEFPVISEPDREPSPQPEYDGA